MRGLVLATLSILGTCGCGAEPGEPPTRSFEAEVMSVATAPQVTAESTSLWCLPDGFQGLQPCLVASGNADCASGYVCAKPPVTGAEHGWCIPAKPPVRCNALSLCPRSTSCRAIPTTTPGGGGSTSGGAGSGGSSPPAVGYCLADGVGAGCAEPGTSSTCAPTLTCRPRATTGGLPGTCYPTSTPVRCDPAHPMCAAPLSCRTSIDGPSGSGGSTGGSAGSGTAGSGGGTAGSGGGTGGSSPPPSVGYCLPAGYGASCDAPGMASTCGANLTCRARTAPTTGQSPGFCYPTSTSSIVRCDPAQPMCAAPLVCHTG